MSFLCIGHESQEKKRFSAPLGAVHKRLVRHEVSHKKRASHSFFAADLMTLRDL